MRKHVSEKRKNHMAQHKWTVAALTLPLVLGTAAAFAQGNVSDQDKHFLQELTKDSNYEIKTAQLALQKSSSQDVKAYANMLIHDHTGLERQISKIDTAEKITPESAGSMTIADHAKYDEMKLLSGESFDKTFIKGLLKGNDEIQKDEKSEAADSTVRTIKELAKRSAELDTKHADKAKELAQAHNIK